MSPKLYRPMMEDFKATFLETAKHYTELRKQRTQYVSLLIFIALDSAESIFTATQLVNAIYALPLDGLNDAIRALLQMQEGSGEQREDYWKNRIKPFWEKIWPKSNEHALNINPDPLAQLCIATGDEFPSAMLVIGKWLQPIMQPYSIINRLHESHLCSKFPEAALNLLDSILDEPKIWDPIPLRQCLNDIVKEMPILRQDRRFMKVDELTRRSGESLN